MKKTLTDKAFVSLTSLTFFFCQIFGVQWDSSFALWHCPFKMPLNIILLCFKA